jgi:hypothetical protein
MGRKVTRSGNRIVFQHADGVKTRLIRAGTFPAPRVLAKFLGGVVVHEETSREAVCARCERPFRFDDNAVTVDTHLVHLLCAAQVYPPRSSDPTTRPLAR